MECSDPHAMCTMLRRRRRLSLVTEMGFRTRRVVREKVGMVGEEGETELQLPLCLLLAFAVSAGTSGVDGV